MMLEGILPVWKPEGMTSHDVVAKARRMLGTKRIGHTGTLDPQVTGVLPLCVGRATRMVEYIQELPKQYEAVLQIGISTDTEDATGRIVASCDRVELEESEVRRTLISFVGELEQVPPMYSAVKVDGKRLYELAREGVEIERKSRKVTIYELDILGVNVDLEHPEIHFRVTCSKGTYIRTLCVDIGRALGYPAVMKQLVRTATGRIRGEQCATFEQLEQHKQAGSLDSLLIPMDQAIAHLPEAELSAIQAEHALQGKKIKLSAVQMENLQAPADSLQAPAALFRLYAPEPDRRFLGLFEWNAGSQCFVPVKVFL